MARLPIFLNFNTVNTTAKMSATNQTKSSIFGTELMIDIRPFAEK